MVCAVVCVMLCFGFLLQGFGEGVVLFRGGFAPRGCLSKVFKNSFLFLVFCLGGVLVCLLMVFCWVVFGVMGAVWGSFPFERCPRGCWSLASKITKT